MKAASVFSKKKCLGVFKFIIKKIQNERDCKRTIFADTCRDLSESEI